MCILPLTSQYVQVCTRQKQADQTLYLDVLFILYHWQGTKRNLHVTVRGCLSHVWFGDIADTEICMLPLLNLLIHAPASDENAQLTVKVITEEGWVPATDISWHPTNHEFLWPAGYGGVVYYAVNAALQFKFWFNVGNSLYTVSKYFILCNILQACKAYTYLFIDDGVLYVWCSTGFNCWTLHFSVNDMHSIVINFLFYMIFVSPIIPTPIQSIAYSGSSVLVYPPLLSLL